MKNQAQQTVVSGGSILSESLKRKIRGHVRKVRAMNLENYQKEFKQEYPTLGPTVCEGDYHGARRPGFYETIDFFDISHEDDSSGSFCRYCMDCSAIESLAERGFTDGKAFEIHLEAQKTSTKEVSYDRALETILSKQKTSR